MASTLAVLTGVLLVLAGWLRLGFVADFISRPVLTGFKVGMGITIAVGQLGNVLGVPVAGDNVLAKAASAVRQLPDASLPTIVVAAATVALLVLLRRVAPKMPGPLVALAGGIVAVGVLGLPGVATAADVPRGLPPPLLPDLALTLTLLPHAAGVAIMTFTESIAAARAFRAPDDPALDANRELLALGGILVAVLLSLAVLLWHLNHPPIVRLGRDPTSGQYRDLALEPNLETVPGLLVARVEGRLFFANARPVTGRLLDLVDTTEPPASVLLLDASSVNDADITAAEAIEELHDALARRGVALWSANLEARVQALAARRQRWAEAQDRVFPTLDAAVGAFRVRS